MTDPVMTKEDFQEQNDAIWADNRYIYALKQWASLQLLNRFTEINHCSPYDENAPRRPDNSADRVDRPPGSV